MDTTNITHESIAQITCVDDGVINTVTCLSEERVGVVTILAQHPPDALIDEETLAGGFGRSTRTIRRWERVGILPPRIPGIGLWRVGNILLWFAARTNIEEKRVISYLDQLVELDE